MSVFCGQRVSAKRFPEIIRKRDYGTMKTISVCMIVKDEEACLRECLEQVSQFADEIVIVDTGSKDATKKIAYAFTEKVYDYTWQNDFAAARNYAFSLGTCDYLMSVDADERFTKENIDNIKKYKENMTGDSILLCCERPEFQTKALQVRMVRRTHGPYWSGKIHEALPASGMVADSKITFYHQKKGRPDYKRNVSIIESLSEEELKANFWLCANCWLDLVLAGEKEKAEILFSYLRENRQPYAEKTDIIFLVMKALQQQNRKKEAAKMLRLSLLDLQRQNRENKERG